VRAQVLVAATYEAGGGRVMDLACGLGAAPRSDSGLNSSLARGRERARRAGPNLE
jgi:hypothetical protein